MNVTEMRRERAQLLERMGVLQRTIEKERRAFTISENETWEDLERETRRLDSAIARQESQDQREADLARAADRRGFRGDPISGLLARTNGGNGYQHDPGFDRLVAGTGLFDYIALGGNIPGCDTGRAREASQEAAKRSGRKFLGVAVPDELFYRHRESRAMTTVQGGDWIGTEYRPDLFVNMLYENMFSPGLGVTIIDNLVENIDIPRQTGSGGASFFAEDSPISLTSLSADKLQGVPKFLGSRHEYSLPMVVQAEPAVQELARRDMVASHSRTIDLAMLTAGGSPAPVGLLGLSIDSSVSMATPSWTTVLELIEKVESNSSTGTGFLGNPPITTMLRSTPRLAAPATTDIMVMESPRELAGYPYVSSMLVPSHHLFFGRWSDLLLLRWKAFDLLVNPYAESSYQRGNVQVRMISCVDIQCRHIESFACATDVALS